MSLSIIKDTLREKFTHLSGAFGFGKSVHEHASQQLLYPHGSREVKEKDGSTRVDQFVDVYTIGGRTILPSPANMSILLHWSKWYNEFMGEDRGFTKLAIDYMVLMPSKNGISREQFTLVATGQALQVQQENNPTQNKVNES
jgi:hypothetical protein